MTFHYKDETTGADAVKTHYAAYFSWLRQYLSQSNARLLTVLCVREHISKIAFCETDRNDPLFNFEGRRVDAQYEADVDILFSLSNFVNYLYIFMYPYDLVS